jgi:glycine/D-amino acid oxidase-like deaminating enzyme
MAGRQWLKTPVGANLLAQIGADPGLPQPNPTISSWQIPAHPEVAALQSRELSSTTDHLIIGSGIAACGVARTLLTHELSESAKVTVLEARKLCSGATGRNGGQLVKPYAPRFAQLAETFGIETAVQVARMALRTLEEMHALAKSCDEELEREANARKVQKRVVYMDQESWEAARKAVSLYETHVPEEKGSFQEIPLSKIESEWNVKGGFGGFEFSAGVCWPYRLVTGVFRRLRDQYPERFTIETHTPATQILYSKDDTYPYQVVTPRGIIRARTLVYCNNGHVGHLLPRMRGMIWPMRGTMSAQGVGPTFPDLSNEYSWSFLGNMKYDAPSQTLEMGWWYGLQNPGGDFWIGGDHKRIEEVFTADDSSVGVFNRETLASFLPKVFKESWMSMKPEIRRLWTGVMAATADTLPFVGSLPSSVTDRPSGNEWIAAGWNSYGMTNGLTSGEAVARMILGEAPPSWLPKAYLPTEMRINGPQMNAEAATMQFLEDSGIGRTFEDYRGGAKL